MIRVPTVRYTGTVLVSARISMICTRILKHLTKLESGLYSTSTRTTAGTVPIQYRKKHLNAGLYSIQYEPRIDWIASIQNRMGLLVVT